MKTVKKVFFLALASGLLSFVSSVSVGDSPPSLPTIGGSPDHRFDVVFCDGGNDVKVCVYNNNDWIQTIPYFPEFYLRSKGSHKEANCGTGSCMVRIVGTGLMGEAHCLTSFPTEIDDYGNEGILIKWGGIGNAEIKWADMDAVSIQDMVNANCTVNNWANCCNINSLDWQ